MKNKLYGILNGDTNYGELCETTSDLEEAERLMKEYYDQDDGTENYYIIEYIKKAKKKIEIVDFDLDSD